MKVEGLQADLRIRALNEYVSFEVIDKNIGIWMAWIPKDKIAEIIKELQKFEYQPKLEVKE